MKKKPIKEYPEEFLEAYQTLGIQLGEPDFDKRIEALQYLINYHQKQDNPCHYN